MDLLQERELVQKGTYVAGFLDSKDKLNEFYERLRVEEGQHFVVINSRSMTVSEGKNSKRRLRWKYNDGGHSIPDSGVPIFSVHTTAKVCCLGPERHRQNNNDHSNDTDHCTPNKTSKKRRLNIKPTVKKNCPAELKVVTVRRYEAYRAECATGYRRTHILKQLYKDIESGTAVGVDRYYILAPLKESHKNHTLQSSSDMYCMRVHPDIRGKIHSLVEQGIDSVVHVKKIIGDHVKQKFKDSDVKPNLSDKGYYPTRRNISSMISASKLALSYSNIDQEILLMNTSSPFISIDDTFCQEETTTTIPKVDQPTTVTATVNFSSLPSPAQHNVEANRARCISALESTKNAAYLCHDRELLEKATLMLNEVTVLLSCSVEVENSLLLTPLPVKKVAKKRKKISINSL